MATAKIKQQIFHLDYWLIFITVALIACGLLLLASASMGISDRQFHQPFHYLLRQVIYLLFGITIGFLLLRVPLSYWKKTGGYWLITSLLLLILVLVPGVGREVNGSIRWLGFGFIALQVSEFAKCAVVIYTAGYLVRRQEEVKQNIVGFVKPMVLVGLISGLLLLEPDFGAVVVILFTTLGMMYLSGARLWQFVVLFLLVGAGLWMLAITSPYRVMRMTAFLNPWARPFDSGYQLVQSLIAFGRGGVFGVGLGNGIQKLFYLPEAHTDFLFAVLAEELGILGQLAVLALFALLVGRILYIGKMAERAANNFACFLAYGLGLLLGLQVIINIGVNIGILPTKGLTLPLMSFGGSSMLFNCIIIAILLRIYHEVKIGAVLKPKLYYKKIFTQQGR